MINIKSKKMKPCPRFHEQRQERKDKIFGPLLLFILPFLHGYSTKNYAPHWFISFICKRPFNQNIWSSFIYFFYLHTTNSTMVLFHLFFLYCTTIRPRIIVLIDLFLLSETTIRPKYMLFIHFCYLHTTIRPIYMVCFHLFFLLQTTIWLKCMALFHTFFLCAQSFDKKIRVLINLSFLFVHEYLTKIRVRSYSLICSFLNCANISYAIFMAALPLYFVRYISWFMSVLPLHLVRYIHGYMKS